MSTVIPASAMGAEIAARSGFFFWLSVLLLSFLLIGFAPTLYLRAFTAPAPILAYLHVHGIVLTSWYVWLVVQTSMVRMGRVREHRRLGVIGAVIGAAVVIAAPMATLGVVGRLRAAGLDWDTDMSTVGALGVEGVAMVNFAAQVVWANFASIAVFAGLLATAIFLRRNPAGAQAAHRARAHLALARARRRGRAVHFSGVLGFGAHCGCPRSRDRAARSHGNLDRLGNHRARDDRAADCRPIRIWLERRPHAGLMAQLGG